MRAREERCDQSLIGGLVTLALLVVALVVGTVVEPIGLAALLLLVAATPIQKWITRRRGR